MLRLTAACSRRSADSRGNAQKLHCTDRAWRLKSGSGPYRTQGGSEQAVRVAQSTRSGGVGRMGVWLWEAGVRLEVVRAYAGEPLPVRLGRRALVVLGGGFLPWEDERAPWPPAARRHPPLGPAKAARTGHRPGSTVRTGVVGRTGVDSRPERLHHRFARLITGTGTQRACVESGAEMFGDPRPIGGVVVPRVVRSVRAVGRRSKRTGTPV